VAFNVFISYSGHDHEQSVVWRLQTLAAAQGIQVYVPKRVGFRLPSSRGSQGLRPTERVAIEKADIVLAIIASKTDRAVENELAYALERNKAIVPIVYEGVQLTPLFQNLPVFLFSPVAPPGTLETQIVDYLKERKFDKERLQAAGAVITIGLGLLLLSAVAKD
jgi:hypothetical protein